MSRIIAAALLAAPLLLIVPGVAPAHAQGQGIVAVVNDLPITELDITQRIALMKIIGDGPDGMTRKQALQALIDDQVKITEATRLKMMPGDGEITDRIARMAKSSGSTSESLLSKLKAQGISEKSFRRYLSALIGFNRIITGKYGKDIKSNPKDVDARMAEIKGKVNEQLSRIMNDPRMKPITVYTLLEVTLPLDGEDAMLLQSRFVEAKRYQQQFKGCGSAKAAASGIFNVKIGKKFEADASKLPPQMKQALDKSGQGSAVGPMRGKAGIQLIGFCGSHKITPPKPDFKMPTREQIERMVINEKYDKIEENYLKTIRGNVYVEYRNNSYAQQ
ncbi:SurA N-terminal domain-containing protein [Aestuariivirga sp.]|uniref:SurA N-terminal domain-containing protein n=1 Tax=Aestuariivirga sp. TaxID=2650926 RepID=UPI003593FF72